MTKGYLYALYYGKIYRSLDRYEQDMHPSQQDGKFSYGSIVLSAFRNVRTITDFETLVADISDRFNSYDERLYDSDITVPPYSSDITKISMDDFKRDCAETDYEYLINLGSDAKIEAKTKTVEIRPRGWVVLHFGEISNDTAQFSSDVSIE